MRTLQTKALDTAANLPNGALAKMHEMAMKFDESLREAEEVHCHVVCGSWLDLHVVVECRARRSHHFATAIGG